MIRVLVTGVGGALGRAVVKRLLGERTYQIFATVFHTTVLNPEISTFFCDVRDKKQFTHVLDQVQPELVLHLATSLTKDFAQAYRINVLSAKHLLDWVSRKPLKTRVILIGSAAEYGVVEPAENPIPEHHVLAPISVYGLTKAWQTQLASLYASQGVDVVCARVFNLWGEGISPDLFAGRVQQQIDAIKLGRQSFIEVGPLTSIRDYVSTDEAARQLLTIVKYGVSANTYHIGSGVGVTMREFLMDQLSRAGLANVPIQEAPNVSGHFSAGAPVVFADMWKTRRLSEAGVIYRN